MSPVITALVAELAARYRDRRRLGLDLVRWVLLSALVLLGSPLGPVPLPPWWREAALLPLAVAIALAHVRPLTALCLAAALGVLDAWFFPALFLISYLVGRHDARERRALFTFAGVVVAGTATLFVLPGARSALGTVPLLVASITPWLVGRYRRLQGELVAAGWQRAADLERRQREVAERARMLERWRIAQDMHDQLGHDLSLLAMRVGVLEVTGAHDERVRVLAGELREVADQAVERLHEIIGVLRADAGRAESGPVRESTAEIVAAAASAGMAVVLHEESDVDDAVPDAVDQAVRLVVREALTNAARYAPSARVEVRVRRVAGWTEVAVTNTAPVPDPRRGARGSGSGLSTLDERVAALGGTLDAGPHQGGFRVAARLPDTRPTTPEPVAARACIEVVVRSGSGGATLRDAGTPRTPGADRRLSVASRTDGFDTRPGPARRMRRSLAIAAAAPLVLVTVLLGAMMAYFADATDDAVLDAATFVNLATGTDRAALAGLLPERQVGVREVIGAPAPAGARCEYYRTRNGDLFESDIWVYRLCFIDGRLVAKDEVSARLA